MQAVSTQQRALQFVSVGTAGVVFAGLVSFVLSLEPRYAFAGLAGLVLAGAAMAFIGYLTDVLVAALAFNIPFTGIEKSFFLTTQSTFVVGGLSVGLAEICVGTLYLLWLGRIFVTKTQTLPSPRLLDWCVLAFWFVHLLSIFGSYDASLTLIETARLAKYSLAYFYLAHNLERRHLKFIAAGLFFALVLQTGIGMAQYGTGKLLGIGQTKGSSEKSYDQYTVDGIENLKRAEGTTFDSHALGLFCAMILPLPLGLALTRGLAKWQRFIAGAVFLIAIPGLILSFARAGWAAFAGAAVVMLFCLIRGQYRSSWKQFIPGACAALVLAAAMVVPLIPKIRQRIFEAPKALVTARFETVEMGLEMWRPVAWTGIGANNYMKALEVHFSIFQGDPYYIPAHNMIIFLLIELGVVGLAVFLFFSWGVVRAAWRATKTNDTVVQTFAGALLAGFAALHLEGVSDPIYVTNVTYFLLWFQLGLIGGLERLVCARQTTGEGAA